MIWLLVGSGGALGAMARHGLNRLIHQHNLANTFPLGIFVVNVLGSGLVGVLGGFTTFSSFSFDTLALVRDGHLGQASWNVAGQVGLSLIAVWLGFGIGGKI